MKLMNSNFKQGLLYKFFFNFYLSTNLYFLNLMKALLIYISNICGINFFTHIILDIIIHPIMIAIFNFLVKLIDFYIFFEEIIMIIG